MILNAKPRLLNVDDSIAVKNETKASILASCEIHG
jgi:hypothetical protein